MQLKNRPRRLRQNESIRSLVSETQISPEQLVLPLFVTSGKNEKQKISAMPGQYRMSPDEILNTAKEAYSFGIKSIALFPHIENSLKDKMGTESLNESGLLQNTIRLLKEMLPDMLVISDVALDPYSSDGHDGIVEKGEILNDETVEVLCQMALSQARAGCDFVAPSDMMDGRVKAIRKTLDENNFSDVGIIAYTAKYASSFYGPFRDALDSKPRSGDKKTYQMDPANSREALRELKLDISEGADIVMVKPALAYLDIISLFKKHSPVPVAAYNVSGEYALVEMMSQNGNWDKNRAMMEILTSIKRAGADLIFTYHALDVARHIAGKS